MYQHDTELINAWAATSEGKKAIEGARAKLSLPRRKVYRCTCPRCKVKVSWPVESYTGRLIKEYGGITCGPCGVAMFVRESLE